MQRVVPSDLDDVCAFLRRQASQAMFPLSNLHRFGLDGAAPYAVSMWMSKVAGHVTGVLTVTRSGTVMPNLPEADFDSACDILRETDISGIIGPADIARPLADRFGLSGRSATLDRDEPHFTLDLKDLQCPDGPATLHLLGTADPEEMIRWRVAYCREALHMSPEQAQRQGETDYETYIAADSHRVLMQDGKALAMTGFNASLPDIVQVGGVYTPPELRGLGHARRALALHLIEARARGVTEATLFSSSDAAARAYRGIGFRQIGLWTLLLFETPQRITP